MYGDALTTKARIKDRLQLTTETFDDLLDNLILAVTARIEQMCGRRFVEGTYTNELHDGCDAFGTPRLMLIVKNAPIQAITSIQYKTGLNSDPNWQTISEDDYDVSLALGIVRFRAGMPRGYQNVRITYVGGYSGHSIGIDNYWVFNTTPTGSINGSNRTFTLPEDASQVVVYADGMREAAANVSFTPGGNSFTLAEGRAPFSTIAADYLREADSAESGVFLPADLVEVCEEVVVKLFTRRKSEGKTGETFGESSITFSEKWFTDDQRAIIKNYRRGYSL